MYTTPFAQHTTSIAAPQNSVWSKIGLDASRYITDDRVEMMLAITRGNIHDTVVMALGYIIQTLELSARTNKRKASEYNSELAHYRQLLKSNL